MSIGLSHAKAAMMGKVAFIFPGQGSQSVGMGREVYEASAAARAVFEEADSVLGESLSSLCFEGPEEALKLTANTQPALLATSIAIQRAFAAECDVVAGHSLGEYSAHVVAKTLAFKDALALVRKRGRYMQEAVPVGVGAMAAVMKADRKTVEQVCAETPGIVEPANYNSAGQTVIAGEAEAVKMASAAFKPLGARAQLLPVSAPFHSSLMKPAEDLLQADLAATDFSDPSLPVYVNVNASAVSDAEVARDALVQQVSRAVRWQQSIEQMIADGAELFIELGPGTVLTRLTKRIDKGVEALSVQSPADFEAAKEAIQGVR